jgi:hypothetical protein
LGSLWAAREDGAAKWRARKCVSAREGLGEKAEGGGNEAADKTSKMIGRM